MITIKCKNGFGVRYEGKIYLEIDDQENKIAVNASKHSYDPADDGLITCNGQTFDIYFVKDIESIHGYEQENRTSPKVHSSSE